MAPETNTSLPIDNSGSCIFEQTGSNWVSAVQFWAEVILLPALNLLVVVGNCLVLLALLVDSQLRNPTHYFICSLALADLTLGLLVLPFAAVFQIRGVWIFGSVFCQIWLAVDVWLCTASIYSLIAVTLDRHIAVTKPLTYRSIMTHRRACSLIVAVWTISLIICLPAFALSLNRVHLVASSTCQCTQMAHSATYIVYSSIGSFYLPIAVILYLYAQIYATIRRIRLSGNSGIVNTSPKQKRRRPVKNNRSAKRRPAGGTKKEHTSLLEKGRQLSAVLRVHRGGYRPPGCSNARKGIFELLGVGFCQPRPPTVEEPSPAPASTAEASPAESRRTSALSQEPSESDNGKYRLNASARRFLTASCPTTGANSPRCSFSGDGLASPRRPSASSLGQELFLNLALPTQLTTLWCQRVMAIQKYQKKFTLELKALKTVGIVTGCFLLCWVGFCIVYTMQALPNCRPARNILNSERHSWTTEAVTVIVSTYSSIGSCVPDWLVNLMVWLGYVNSAINPIIYGISNQQFRRAFRRIMRCESIAWCYPINQRYWSRAN